MHTGQKKGYTLIELLLAISLVIAIAGFSIPITSTFLRQNEINIAFRVIASSVRKAHIYSKTGYYDAIWGFRVESDRIIVFRGANYASRNTSFDEISTIPSRVTITGINESTFAKLTGIPSTTGNINLTNASSNRIITLNSRGLITY